MKKFIMFLAIIIFFANTNKGICGIKGHSLNPKDYVGNVSGRVLDKQNGKPINDAKIYISLRQTKNCKIANYESII